MLPPLHKTSQIHLLLKLTAIIERDENGIKKIWKFPNGLVSGHEACHKYFTRKSRVGIVELSQKDEDIVFGLPILFLVSAFAVHGVDATSIPEHTCHKLIESKKFELQKCIQECSQEPNGGRVQADHLFLHILL